jgi:site-specific recombinase XerD
VKVGDFSQKNILEFMDWLATDRGNAAPTINHRLSDIRGFCRFLKKKKAVSEVDYETIREITDVADDRVIDFTWLSFEDVKRILDQVSGNRDSIRDRFLLSLLYESGARINEVLSLNIKDLKPTSSGEVDVHFYGKGNKHRITPLSSEIWEQFNTYADKYLPDRKPEDLLFFSYRNGKRNKMSSDNVSRILNDCETAIHKEDPGLIHLHSHLFRRTRAMHLYQAGVPLPTISDWLGHSNIETTRFYAKVTEKMKRDAMHKLSESDKSVFKNDVAFKYAGDEEMLRRLCGLK